MKVKAECVYEFQRQGFDLLMPEHCEEFINGDLVRVKHYNGCPAPNVMGQANIELVGNANVRGMCSTNSLIKRRPEGDKA